MSFWVSSSTQSKVNTKESEAKEAIQLSNSWQSFININPMKDVSSQFPRTRICEEKSRINTSTESAIEKVSPLFQNTVNVTKLEHFWHLQGFVSVKNMR